MSKLSVQLNSFATWGKKITADSYKQLIEIYTGKRSELPRLLNSIMLILARVSSSALGFLTWLLVARLYTVEEVGIASGITSSMMLIVQFALLGINSAFIVLFGGKNQQVDALLNNSLTMVAATALLIAGAFLLLSSFIFSELVIVSQTPLYSLFFLGICLFGTINVMLDNVSIAMRRGDEVFIRNFIFGIVTILGATLLPYLLGLYTSMIVILAWVLAGFTACLIGVIQLYKSKLRYLYSPLFKLETSKNLISIGLPNYLLTIAERTPNWIIPIAITELMSPTDNAHWYSVWMMTWVVFIIPISIAQNLFAEIARNLDASVEKIQNSIYSSIRQSLILSLFAVIGIEIIAYYLLLLLGSEYAIAGTTPLRILVLAVFPITIIQTYYSVCRANHRLIEATVTGGVSGFAGVTLTVLVGVQSGLISMAITWLVVQVFVSLWAFWRLNKIVKLIGTP